MRHTRTHTHNIKLVYSKNDNENQYTRVLTRFFEEEKNQYENKLNKENNNETNNKKRNRRTTIRIN